MALYAIGDTHLSLGSNKPMDVFGGGWAGYVDKLREGIAHVTAGDTVLLCGDLSWGMSLDEARNDFAFLDREIPGEKWLLKGNHDYWWTTASKMNAFFVANGFTHLHILHNNCAIYREYALCGTRGWFFEENGAPQWEKVFRREIIRLKHLSRPQGGGKSFAFFTILPFIVDTVAKRLLTYWSSTKCRPVITATFMGPAIVWPSRDGRDRWITIWFLRTLSDSVRKKFWIK